MKTAIIVQARMTSTRLPGKVLKPILNRPMLSLLIEQLRRVTTPHTLIIAIPTGPAHDPIAELCIQEDVAFFRGSEEDVLDRYFQSAKAFSADVIVRISSDCPLMDPSIVDQCIRALNQADYASNILTRSYPRGMDVEAFTFQALEKAAVEAIDQSEREHVTPFIYKHPELFKLESFKSTTDNSHYRLTVDTPEDFELIKLIYENLYPKNPNFHLQDILKVLKDHPDWVKINAHVKQKEV